MQEKGQDIPIGDGVKQIEDTVRNRLLCLTTRWLEDIMASSKLYRKYIRVCSERRLYDQLGRLLKMIYVSMQTQMVNTTGPITVVAKLRSLMITEPKGIQLYSWSTNLV
jgi:hypothetical protein